MVGISKRFGGVQALSEAQLVVRRGTVHAVLGENGAGKTTLMRIAYGLVRPDGGTISIDGTPKRFDSPRAAITAGIGMVQQHSANVPAMTVAENIAIGKRGRFRPTEARHKARQLAERVGFALDVDATAGSLSVADAQRLDILTAI